jgi:hypothetical protein
VVQPSLSPSRYQLSDPDTRGSYREKTADGLWTGIRVIHTCPCHPRSSQSNPVQRVQAHFGAFVGPIGDSAGGRVVIDPVRKLRRRKLHPSVKTVCGSAAAALTYSGHALRGVPMRSN